MELRRSAVITKPSASGKEDACEVCRWQRENEKQKTPEQFHQGRWFHRVWKGTDIYRYQIYFGIGKNICQRKLFVCYHIDTTPLLVDMVNCYWTSQFYHKSVRSCFILSKKNPVFMRVLTFRKRLSKNNRKERKL